VKAWTTTLDRLEIAPLHPSIVTRSPTLLPAADASIVAQMAEEIQAKGVIELHLTAPSAFQLAALLQLALRHPGPSADLRRTGEMFVGHVRAFFADCPATLEIIRRGDDPREDRR
jgi:hypothetical protein